MEPEDALTKRDVRDMHAQGVPTSEILGLAARRLGLDPDAVMRNQGLTPLQALSALTPAAGDAPAGEGEARIPERLRLDQSVVENSRAADLAYYMGDMLGVNVDRLVREEGMSFDEIIAVLGDPESVEMAPGGGLLERTSRAAVRGAPSLVAGTGAALLAAPSGPVGSGVAGVAAGTAAAPIGAQLEEAVFGPRVPLVPGQQFGGRVGEIVGAGLPFIYAPYAFTAGVGPRQLSLLASRRGRDLTPAQSIGVQAVTRPGQAATSELTALMASGAAGATAAQAFPEQDLVATGAELAAGVLAPGQTISDLLARAGSPLARGADALINRDIRRLSRSSVFTNPEDSADTRLFNLSDPTQRASARILRDAGWEETPTRTAEGFQSASRIRSENMMTRLVGRMMRDFQENPLETARALRAAAEERNGLRQLAQEYGLDPSTIPERLPTAGVTDSPAVRAIHATIQNVAGSVGRAGEGGPTQARARAQELVRGFEGLQALVDVMSRTGDPEDFADAMRLQDELFQTQLETALDTNLAAVTSAVERLQRPNPRTGISPTDPNARSQAGEAIADALNGVLGTARRQETALWNQVDRSEELPLSNTARVVQEIREELGLTRGEGRVNLEGLTNSNLRSVLDTLDAASAGGGRAGPTISDAESALAAEARAFMGQTDDAAELASPTVGDALVIKRALFRRILAARSSQNPDYVDARFYGQLYDAVMSDLGVSAESIAAQGGRQELSESQRALLQANQFSRALNDVFTRSFIGQAMRRDAVGGFQTPPELLGRYLLSGSADRTALAMRAQNDAVDFVGTRLELTPDEAAALQSRAGTLRSNNEMLLRIVANRAVNPETGEVNMATLNSLLNPSNPAGIAPALEMFEGLREDLSNAQTAQRVLRDFRQGQQEAARERPNQRDMDAQDWLRTVLNRPPAEAVNQGVGEPGARPQDAVGRLRGLIRIANQNGGEFAEFARQGLLDTILDQGLVYAGHNARDFDFGAFRDYLFSPLNARRGESNSVAGVLREQDVLSDQQLANLNILLRQGERVQRALQRSETDAELVEALRDVPMFNWALLGRFVGAAEGARLARAAGRGNIQIPAYAANLGAQIFSKIPVTSLQDVMVKFLDDPEFAEMIIRRAANLNDMRGNRALRYAERLARDTTSALARNGLLVLAAGETADIQREGEDVLLPVGAANAATPNAALEEYLQSVQQPAPAQPATPAASPRPTNATPAVGAPPPAVPRAAPAAPRAGGQGASYSALFPNDPISPMLQQRELQQGIGALMPGPR